MKFGSLLLVVAMAVFCTNTRAQAPVLIKFSHVVAEDTPKGKAAQRFKELAEKLTGGRVKVEIHPNGELYKDNEELRALQLGAVQMLAPSLAKFSSFGIREFEAFDLPYAFPDMAAVHAVTEGELGAELFKKLEPKGITGLAYWDNGFKVMSANRPLHHPADFRGLKMRIQPSKVLDTQMRILGATPLVLDFTEVYQALRTGVVDGTENPPSNFLTQRMQEVQANLTLSNHGFLGYAVIVNKNFWDRLPPDIRKSLKIAMRDATKYEYDIAQSENDMAVSEIRKSEKTKVYELTPQEQAEWRAAFSPIQREMEGRIGKDFISALEKAVAATK